MKMRTLSLGSAALLMVTLLSTSIVSATPPAGHGNKSQGAACVAATPTPTPTPVPGASPTPTPTPTPTPSPTPTPTPTPVPGASPTPTPTPSPTPAKVASFSAKVTPGHPCGTIKVQAKVLHPVRGRTFSASATAHFSGGVNVTVQLRRAGKSFVAVGKIKVPAGQAANVPVEINITYGGAAQPVIEKIAKIKAP